MRSGQQPPAWLTTAEEIHEVIVKLAARRLEGRRRSDFDVTAIPQLALHHHLSCWSQANEANRTGMHSVSLTLLRSCIESLSLIELGLSDALGTEEELIAWRDCKHKLGDVRKFLELNVWPSRGHGLRGETWTETMTLLAKHIQPYAHYSRQLQWWQLADASEVLGLARPAANRLYVIPGKYDPLKASRITIMLVVLVWALGRIVCSPADHEPLSVKLDELGRQLSSDRLLFGKTQWEWDLNANVLYYEPGSWRKRDGGRQACEDLGEWDSGD